MNRGRGPGRHRSRTDRLWIAAGLAMVASALVMAGAFRIIRYEGPPTAPTAGSAPGRGGGREAPNPGPASDENGGQISPGDPQGGSTPRPRVAATTEAVAHLLVELLPPGKVEWVYREENPLSAYAAFTRNGIATFIRIGLRPIEARPPGDPLLRDPDQVTVRSCTEVTDADQCTTLPSGAVVRFYENRSCQDHISVLVDRPGFRLELLAGSCSDENVPIPANTGDETKPRTVLNPAEAALIAGNDEWGLTMRPELVAAGRKDYPALPLLPLPERVDG